MTGAAWLMTTTLLMAAPDFDPQSGAWNGLRYLFTTAEEAKVDLVVATDRQIDWSVVDTEQVLILVMPDDGVLPKELVEFIHDGGHAIVVVDLGADEAVLEAFGLRLVDAPVVHDAYFRDHPSFPRFPPPGGAATAHATLEGEQGDADAAPHFLWFNVEELVLNHPAAIRVDEDYRGPAHPQVLIEFAEPGQAFAIEVGVGGGYALFLSDASALINDMQRHAYGDKQFAANVLRYYCEEQCGAILLLPGTTGVGRYPSARRRGLGGLEQLFAVAIEELNGLAEAGNRWLGSREVLFGLVVVVLASLGIGLMLLPWPRPTPNPAWVARGGYRHSHTDYWVSALGRARSTADFSAAATALGGLFLRRLEGHLQVPSHDLEGEDVAALAAQIGRKAPGTEEVALRCLRTFNKVRPHPAGGRGPRERLGVSEFERLYNECETVLAEMSRDTR